MGRLCRWLKKNLWYCFCKNESTFSYDGYDERDYTRRNNVYGNNKPSYRQFSDDWRVVNETHHMDTNDL